MSFPGVYIHVILEKEILKYHTKNISKYVYIHENFNNLIQIWHYITLKIEIFFDFFNLKTFK